MKDTLLTVQECICLLYSGMWQIFSPLLCQLILSQTILSSSPSTSSLSRHQNELLSPTIVFDSSPVSERRQKGRDTVLIEGRKWLQSHLTQLPIPTGQCQGRTRALQGLAVSEAAPPPSFLSPFPPWVHPCPWV